jgi:RHS repeat-associated protein
VIASSWLDPVLGIDVHWEMVPTPAPVPTPIPNPFTGLVFDPSGLACGLALSNAMNLVVGAPFQGPVVYWGAIPATNTGTEAKHVPGHILIPPGVSWAPVPKTPKPVIHPGETPSPPKPVVPDNDAVCITGSKTVSVMGSNAVRIGDLLLSCSEPVRLPSSVVLAIPKGAPILIGGPPSLDLMAAALASLRTRFIGDSIQALLSRMKPSRLRSLLQRGACLLTGHPVDVATGKVLTSAVDAELPGPLPLRFERVYTSSFAGRPGPLGHGWSFSLDQAVWEERGKVVYLAADGREIEFDAFDLPDHRMRVGDELWHPIERLTLRRGERGFRLVTHEGEQREFEAVDGETVAGRARLRRIVSRCGSHVTELAYDARARLEWVRDASGRLVGLEHDAADRIVALKLPLSQDRGWYVHRRFEYDAAGDLVRVVDSQGHAWRFEYVTHLLVRETDRNGLSFHFEYDGLGQDAWCTRTWGDGGLYDHRIAYDKANHVTFVTNSLGETTRYHMNAIGLVTKLVDGVGGEHVYEYDPRTLARVRSVDPIGYETRHELDARGNVVKSSDSAGARLSFEVSEDVVTRVEDTLGNAWVLRRDGHRRLVEKQLPTGERFGLEWAEGLMVATYAPGGRVTRIEYGRSKLPRRVTYPNGSTDRYQHDGKGRLVRIRGVRGCSATIHRDPEGRVVEVHPEAGPPQRFRYDPEGNVVESCVGSRVVRYRYEGLNQVAEVEEAGSVTRYEHDSEGALRAVVNAAGERYELVRDRAGRIVHERRFDGTTRDYELDPAGLPKRVRNGAGRSVELSRDGAGRVVAVSYGDEQVELDYRVDGVLLEARTADGSVRFERDVLGRVLAEEQRHPDGAVFSTRARYGADGMRVGHETSLGARLALVRDALGEIVSMHVGAEALTSDRPSISIGRDAAGNELERHLPGGIVVDSARDLAGRPWGRRIRRSSAGSESVLDAYTFAYDERGAISSLDDAMRGPTAYARDDRGRLVGAQRSPASTATSGAGVAVASSSRASGSRRHLDAAGNPYATVDGRDRRYAPGGRLEEADGTRFEHDADGQLVRKVEPSGAEWRYAWSPAGMLREIQRPDGKRVQFGYDAFGRRLSKRVLGGGELEPVVEREVRFAWDGDVVVHESCSDTGLTTWYWDPDCGELVAKQSREGTRFAVSDQVGTPTELFDEHGALRWSGRLDLWGRLDVEQGDAQDCPWRWPGQYDDADAELTYHRWRWYSPAEGVFLRSDPLGLDGSFAAYAYVDDPLAQVDPLGLEIVVLGEAQRTRVMPTARAVGGREIAREWPAERTYRSPLTPAQFDDSIDFNRGWIRDRIAERAYFVDVGRDPARVAAGTEISPWYKMELEELERAGYRRVFTDASAIRLSADPRAPKTQMPDGIRVTLWAPPPEERPKPGCGS